MPGAADLLRLAEEASVYEPLKQGEEVVATDRYVLSLGTGRYPEANDVNRLRCAGDVEGAVEEIRSRVLAHGGKGLLWRVSSAAEPTDLADLLLDLGAAPAEPPAAVALALLEQPSPAPADVHVTRVETLDDFRMYVRLTHEVFGVEDRLPHALAEIERDGERVLADRRFVRYLAWVDGGPAGAAGAAFGDVGAVLYAGSTRVAARGRGAYRALVRARWTDAQERGIPALVTWSGSMSEPILRRLGFFDVGRQRSSEMRSTRPGRGRAACDSPRVLLYENPVSGNCYKVRLLFAHLGVRCERRFVDVVDRSDRDELLGGLNPAQRVPTVVLDDGSALAESNAILWYFGEGTRFVPDDRLDRARVLQWMFFEQYDHEPAIAVARFLRSYSGRPEAFEQRRDELLPRGRRALEAMDRHLAGREWLVGERMTIADVCLYAYTHAAGEGGFELEPYAAVRAWLDRVSAHPGHVPIDA